jgi:single stranded DNA-binding protein
MKGIQCAFTGKLGQDPELKTSKSGNPWASFHVAVDEASEETTTWVRIAVFGELATRLHPELKKGTEVYCEGRLLKLDSWTGRDGRERTGLAVAAARLEVLGRVGFNPHQRKPKPEQSPLKQPEFEGQGRTEHDLPF